MSEFIRYLITISLLCLALLSYSVGFNTGTYILIALGGLFELGFWIGVFTTNTETDSSTDTTISSDL